MPNDEHPLDRWAAPFGGPDAQPPTAEAFNPYVRWLGLAAPPADEYQLLSLPRFESDLITIAAAADRAILRVRSQRPAEHARAWSKLLDELSAAKRRLTDEFEKNLYDDDLRGGGTTRQLTMDTAPPAQDFRFPPASAAPWASINAADSPPSLPYALPNTFPPAAPNLPFAVAAPTSLPPAPPVPASWPPAANFLPPSFAPTPPPPPSLPLPPASFDPMAPVDPMADAYSSYDSPPVSASFGPPTYTPPAYDAAPAYDPPPTSAQAEFSSLARPSRLPPKPLASKGSNSSSVMMTVVLAVTAMAGLVVGFAIWQSMQETVDNAPQIAQHKPAPKVVPMVVKPKPPEPMPKPKPPEPMPEIKVLVAPPEEMKKPDPVPKPEEMKPVEPVKPVEPPPLPKPEEVKPVELPPLPTKEDVIALASALKAAREALKDGNIETARASIAKADKLPSLPEHGDMIDRLSLLTDYNDQFWRAVGEGIKSLEVGTEVMVGSQMLVVVSAEPDQVTFRVNAMNKTYAVKALPGGIAMMLANRWLTETDATTKVICGAYCAANKVGNKAQAKTYWDEALKGGATISNLYPVLDDNYDMLVKDLDKAIAARMPAKPEKTTQP